MKKIIFLCGAIIALNAETLSMDSNLESINLAKIAESTKSVESMKTESQYTEFAIPSIASSNFSSNVNDSNKKYLETNLKSKQTQYNLYISNAESKADSSSQNLKNLTSQNLEPQNLEWNPNSQNLNIQEAFDLVLLNNESLKASFKNIEKSQKIKDSTYMLFAPNIDIIGSYNYIDEKMKLNLEIPNVPLPIGNLAINLSTNRLAYGLINIIYPLYTGGKRLAALDIANLNIDDANFLMQINKINLFEKLIKAYYGLKLNIEVYKSLKDVENGAKEHLENALKLEENAQIAKIERLSAQVEYDKAKNKALQAKDTAEIALLGLKTIIQDENIAQNVLLDENGKIINLNLTSELLISTKELESLQNYQSKTLASYPALKTIETKKEQVKKLGDIEFANFLPTIGLQGGYVFKDNSILLNKIMPNWYIGVTAKLTLISPSGRIFKYQANKIAQSEIEHTLSQAKKDILLLVESAYKEALSARESYKNFSSTILLAKENLKLQEEAFINGMANNTQVSDARNQLSFATIELKNSQYKYILALAKLYALSNDIESFYLFTQN
ncbi:MAG: TolC family protein [Helicobacteraceae bacterium]|nr:TolC family protein [Helicobacteraceae bacterium]